MNTMGKILVIIILLLALTTAGFHAYDFIIRTNYARAFKELQEEYKVQRANVETQNETITKLTNQLKRAESNRESELVALRGRQGEVQVALERARADLEVYKGQFKAAERNLAQAQETAERLQQEIKLQKDVVTEREKDILKYQSIADQWRDKYAKAESDYRVIHARAENLTKRTRELEQKYAEMTAGAGTGGRPAASPRDPFYSNPPKAAVEGTIIKVDPSDPTRVVVSVGSDHGLNVNNTLDVYRLSTQTYLGTLRIVQAHERSAIGQLISSTAARSRIPLKEGDTVGNLLSMRQ